MPVRFFNYNQLSNDQIYQIKKARWLARTDLQFLCNNVLDYPHVSRPFHAGLLDSLQKFPYPKNNEEFVKNDDISTGYVRYVPLKNITTLEGSRRTLILDYRSSMKTTINAVAHTIQWILNYPNIAILICQSSSEKAEEIVKEIKRHFQYNEKFRQLFPEHCPWKKVDDWGTIGKFTTEYRDFNFKDMQAMHDNVPHKEETVISAGIDKGLAGKHLDILKFSDIVDPSNAKTENGCREVIKSYFLMESLLTDLRYWIDMEGTRYSYNDLYGFIADREIHLKPEERTWKIYARSCYKKKTKDGQPQKFTIEELDLPDLTDKSLITPRNPMGYVGWWPEKFPPENFEDKRKMEEFTFSSQYLLKPLAAEPGMIPFEINDKLPVWQDATKFKQKVPVAYYDIAVDTAETDGKRSNYSAIVVGAFTAGGSCVIVDIIHGKFLPDKLIDEIINAYLKYNPRSVKIEKTSFVRGLMPGLRKESEKYGIYIPVEEVAVSNRLAKTEKIIKTLQPLYINGHLRFLSNLTKKNELLEEFRKFPAWERNDILDALSTLFDNKDYFGRENPKKEFQNRGHLLQQEYLKRLPKMTEAYLGIGDYDFPTSNPNNYDRTGL